MDASEVQPRQGDKRAPKPGSRAERGKEDPGGELCLGLPRTLQTSFTVESSVLADVENNEQWEPGRLARSSLNKKREQNQPLERHPVL